MTDTFYDRASAESTEDYSARLDVIIELNKNFNPKFSLLLRRWVEVVKIFFCVCVSYFLSFIFDKNVPNLSKL